MELSKYELTQALLLAIKRINLALEHQEGLTRYGDHYLEQAKTLSIVALNLIEFLHHPNPELVQEELYTLISVTIEKIEASGASVPLTNAVVLVSDISSAIGNKWNPPQPYRADAIRKLIGTS